VTPQLSVLAGCGREEIRVIRPRRQGRWPIDAEERSEDRFEGHSDVDARGHSHTRYRAAISATTATDAKLKKRFAVRARLLAFAEGTAKPLRTEPRSRAGDPG